MLSETFQVAAIIEKLPPSWKNFKSYLKYKRKEMSIEDLVIILRTEEDNRGSEKKMAHNPNEAKANFMEHGQSSKFKKGNNKGKDTKLGPKEGIVLRKKKGGKKKHVEPVRLVHQKRRSRKGLEMEEDLEKKKRNVVSMNHHLLMFVLNMGLYVKPQHLIHLNPMEW